MREWYWDEESGRIKNEKLLKSMGSTEEHGQRRKFIVTKLPLDRCVKMHVEFSVCGFRI
jgi:hypothetical protein